MGIFQNLVVDALARHFPRLRESLRVNLLRGKLNLENIEIAPSILILNNLPLQINDGKIGSLSVHVPWTKLYSSVIRALADEVFLSLSEIRFPLLQQAVFDAFASDSDNEKKRQLAGGERGKSPLSRILARILPILLDRFELDIKNVTIELKFASGQIGIFRLKSLSTKPTSQVVNRGDLEKLIIASGVSFTISREVGRPFLSLSETCIFFTATFRGGAWEIDIKVPNFDLEVDNTFPCFLKSVSTRSTHWNAAYWNKRPNEAVAENPRIWFQYLVRLVIACFCKRRIYFSEGEARRTAKLFVEYKELHVRRLRRIISAPQSIRLLEIEHFLNADAIIVLRDQARRHALADEVSSFATRDWLGWALFGTEVSQEQEQIAEELKHSLTVAKHGQANSSQIVLESPTSWSKIRFGICISVFRGAVVDETSAFSFNIKTLALQAELDSTLKAYSCSLYLGSASIADGDELIWIGNFITEGSGNSEEEEQDLRFLSFKLHKLGYEREVTSSVTVHSSRADLGFITSDSYERMRRIAAFARNIQLILSTSFDRRNHFTTQRYSKTMEIRNIPIKMSINIVRFIFFVGVGTPKLNNSFKLCCSLSDAFLRIERKQNIKIVQRGTLEITGYQPSSSTGFRKGTVIIPNSDWKEKAIFLQFTATLSVYAAENHLKVDLKDSAGFFTLFMAPSFINSIRNARKVFTEVTPQFNNGVKRKAESEETTLGSQFVVCILRIPSMDFSFRECDEENSTTEVARLRIENFSYETRERGHQVIRIRFLKIYELLQHGSIALTKPEIALTLDESDAFGSVLQRIEAEVEELNVSLSGQGLSRIFLVVDRAFEGTTKLLCCQTSDRTEQDFSQRSHETDGPAVTVSFSVRLQMTVFKYATRAVRIQTSLENLLLVRQDSVLSGFLDNLEVKDTTDLSSRYKTLLRCTASGTDYSSRRRALSFVTSSGTTNIQVSALQVVWLKSVNSEIWQMIHLFESIIDNLLLKIRTTMLDYGSMAKAQERHQIQEIRPLTVQGWDLAVIFPFVCTHSEAVCISSSHVTATLSSKGQVMSMRGGQILTRIDSSQEQSLSSEHHESIENQWVVLVREIDMDLSHHNDLQTSPSYREQAIRDKWSIDILRKVSFFVAPSQIQALRRFISNVFDVGNNSRPSRVVSENAREAEHNNPSRVERHLKDAVVVEEITLQCQTQHISAELLGETLTGTIAPISIANLNLDPTRLSWKRSSKYNGAVCAVDVISWRLTSAAVSLEDRTNRNPGTRRMILHTRHDIDRFRSFHDLPTRVQVPKTTVCIEAIERTDMETKATSSFSVSLSRVEILACPTIFQVLKQFWDQCVERSSEITLGGREEYGVHEREIHADFDSAGGKESVSDVVGKYSAIREAKPRFLKVPISKVSLSLHDTNFLLFSGIEGGRNPFLNVAMESAKVILLNNYDGSLLEGCQMKVKNVSVTLLRYSNGPRAFFSRRENFFGRDSSEGSSSGLNYHDLGSLTGESSSFSDADQASKRKFSVRLESDEGPVRSGSESLESTETLFHLEVVNIRLPSIEQNQVVFAIPDISIECPFESFLHFVLQFSDFKLAPKSNHIADAGNDDEVLIWPDMKLALGSVSLRTRIETTAALLTQCDSVRNHASIRLTSHWDLLITENLSRWIVNVKAAGDVVDEEKGICDPILSPSSLSIEARNLGGKFIKIWTKHLLRVALSPLTVRAVAGMGFTGSQVLENHRKWIVENRSSGGEKKGLLNGMEVQFSVPGIVIRCFAEQPRAQLLRLVLRDVKYFMSFPTTINEEGKAELSIRDVILEDTISSYLPDHGTRESHSKPCYAMVISAQEDVRVQLPRFASATDVAFRPRYENLTGEESMNWESTPVVFCIMSWYTPFEQVTAQIGGTGLDIQLKLGSTPTFAEWFETLLNEFAAVQRAQHRQCQQVTEPQRTATTSSFPLGIDHIVVEPLRFKIGVSAPARDLQLSWVRRALSWMVSAESTDGMVIRTPKVVFSGDFSSTEQFLHTFRSSYMRALLSRRILKQVILQTPQVTRLWRVIVTSWARRRSHLALISGHERYAERKGSAPNLIRGIGLVGALSKVQFALATHIREVHDVERIEEERSPVPPSSKSAVDDRAIQTIDITERRLPSHNEDASQSGKSLFLWLRAHDNRIPRNERFENMFSFSPTVSMLITSRYVLFVNRSTRSLQEPIITRANIAEYHKTGPRITIVTVSSDITSVARFAALQCERDSHSLARYLRASPRISQIHMHEIECTSAQYASWLLQQFPQQNEILRSRLYQSR